MRKLRLIIIILLILIYISSNILLKEIQKSIPEIDYTIYDVEDHLSNQIEEESIIGSLIDEFRDQNREYNYKFFKKFKLVAYCDCELCQAYWTWTPTKYKLTQGFTIAANPEDLSLGTPIKILTYKYIVFYTDESIPKGTLYVYVDSHDNIKNDEFSGIHDIYIVK